MAILFSNEILAAIKKELKEANNSVQIITAYCKESSLAYLNECINQQVKDKRLLLRFRMDDIIKGSTDFSVLNSAINSGWKVYIRFDLHAKTYIVDNKRGFVGSANVTRSGLGIGKNGNMEMATLVDVEPQDILKIENLFCNALLVDEDIISKMERQLDAINSSNIKESYSWDTTITALFSPRIDMLFSYELPDKNIYLDGEYIAFLDYTYSSDLVKIKEDFRWCNAYLWLINVLKENEGCLYFGALSAKLHESLISDPKPHRKDVKDLLSNLLAFIEKLEMEEIIIDRPNFSQRVRLSERYS